MKMTLNLWDIVDRWKEIIVNSDKINDFCTKNYGKKPMIYLGADPKEPPEEENTPFILIMPGGKKKEQMKTRINTSYIFTAAFPRTPRRKKRKTLPGYYTFPGRSRLMILRI